jgi:hypothetical protein
MSNCCNQVQPADITATLAAGSATSPYYFMANISQRLCFKSCVQNTPVFNPRFSLLSYSKVGTNQYVATIHCEGIISYVPCNGGCDCTKQQPLSQNFTIPFYFSGTPLNVALTQGSTINTLAATNCQTCSRNFVSETPIALTVSATAAANSANS